MAMINSGSPVVLTMKNVNTGEVLSMQQVAPADIERIESSLRAQAESLSKDGQKIEVFKLSRVG